MINNQFDYIIIGNGMAGLKLALAIYRDSYFKDKQIALIDYSSKNTNDKTWCFWDKNPEKWQPIIHKKWAKTKFFSSNYETTINLEPYFYNMIRSIDFYDFCKDQLQSRSNFHFIKDEIISVEEKKDICLIKSKSKNTYHTSHVFDSRIPEEYYNNNSKYIKIYQHFKGWVIKTDTPIFKTDAFTVMDYRIKYKNTTAFTYVLPFSATSALVEFTFFTPFTIKNEEYDEYLKTYISKILNIDSYSINEVEKGIIPMTNFPFKNYSSKRITKIGTAGGWVKPSSGYSFKLTDAKIEQLIINLKANRNPSKNLISKKYSLYDSLFLRVLHDDNHKGEWIFKQFYSKNSVNDMFSFLDETSSLYQDFNIIKSLLSWSFIRALFK